MMILASALVFAAAYLVNMFFITVLYHRGLAHGSVVLHPRARAWVVRYGSWVTGIDPKAWACMHRLHHEHSDTGLDPHSPVNLGVFGVMLGQLKSYERILAGLSRGNKKLNAVVSDLDFPISWVNRKKVWLLPYAIHLFVAVLLAVAFHSPILGAAYFLGMMSHPVQGFMVNAFAHRYGYRNHESADQSTNNTLVAWLAMGEGYQNNHHAHPESAKFSERWFEVDAGYGLCVAASKIGMVRFPKPGQRLPREECGFASVTTGPASASSTANARASFR